MEYIKEEELNECIELFISILICFPEVAKLCFNRETGIVHFSFLLKNVKKPEITEQRLKRIDSSVCRYHRLNKTSPQLFAVNKKYFRENVILDAKRDIKTLSQTEISFLIELFRMEFIDCLMVEKTEETAEEEYRCLYEDGNRLIHYRQELRLDRRKIGNDIVVCRECGKVLVFSN